VRTAATSWRSRHLLPHWRTAWGFPGRKSTSSATLSHTAGAVGGKAQMGGLTERLMIDPAASYVVSPAQWSLLQLTRPLG